MTNRTLLSAIFFASLISAFLVAPFPACAATPQTHIGSAGLYGLIPVNQSVTSGTVRSFLEDPLMAGISVRTDWMVLEAVEDEYDFSYIDEMIALAQSYDKRIMLRVGAGRHAPDWVFDAGAVPFPYREQTDDPEDPPTRMAIPWDPVFRQKWGSFINELGRRYNTNPGLAVIIITGASRSTEMYLPNTAEDQANWALAGYTPELLIGAWNSLVERYAAAFPDKPWLLSLSNTLYDDGVVESVVAYGVDRYPWQFSVKIAYWSSTNATSYFPTAALLATVDELAHGGLEPVNSLGDDDLAIANAIDWGAITWAEPYPFHASSFGPFHAELLRHQQIVASSQFDAFGGAAGGVDLAWQNPSGYVGFQEVKVVRKEGAFPSGHQDPGATVVYQGSAESFFDAPASDGEYFYTLYELPSGYVIGQQRLNVTATTSVTFEPRADTSVFAGSPGSVFGRATLIAAQPDLFEGLLGFDVTGTGAPQSATLYMRCLASALGRVTTFEVSDVTWMENTTTWETRPPFGQEIDSVLVEEDARYAFDLSSYIVGPGAYSIGLAMENAGITRCSSKEGEDPPMLVVTW